MARETRVALSIAGASVEDDLLSITYTDHDEDKADDLQITLQDRERKWLSAWLDASTKGLIAKANIGGLDCGSFSIDNISSSGPPNKVTIKAISIPANAELTVTENTKAWEKIKLSAIAGEIAGKGSLALMFESTKDPFYERKEQVKKTDIMFLRELCKDAGISIKITDTKMVLFLEQDYESKGPVAQIVYGGSDILSYKLETNTKDAGYSECEVTYMDPEAKVVKGKFSNPASGDLNSNFGSKKLKINSQVNTAAEADDLAKQSLREKNKKETKADFEMMGNPGLVAGVNVQLSGFGLYDGKYFIESATHSVSNSGYKTSISCRRTLQGY